MGTLVWSAKRGRMWTGAVVVAVMAVLGGAAPQVKLPEYSYTVGTAGAEPSQLGSRQRLLLRPSSRESVEAAAFPPPLPPGAKAGQVLLQPASTESLEVNGHGHGGGEIDSIESGAYRLAVALGNSVPSAGRGRIPGSTNFLAFDDDNDSHDFLDSFEDDDDDARFMTLGRRYHPEGVVPLSPKDLFIPPYAPLPVHHGPAAPKTFTNPFFYNLEESAEDDFSGEDLSDLYYGYSMPSSAVGVIRGEASSEERVQLDEALLGKRYNFVDGQGSRVWGYNQVDQHQHQVVRQDGTMEGKFGWTAPNGHQVSIEYVADRGGYRVVSSHGIYTPNTHKVQELNEQHAKAHQAASSRTRVVDQSHSKLHGGGIPLPPLGQPISPTYPGQPGSSNGGVPLPGPGPIGPGFTTHNTFSGGVPLPSPAGPSTGPVFYGDEDEATLMGGGGGGVPLPSFIGPGTPGDTRDRHTGSDGSFGVGVPLPSPVGPNYPGRGSPGFATPGFTDLDYSDPTLLNEGGVPLPSPTGPGTSASSGPGTHIPRLSGLDTTGGVPLPSPYPGAPAGGPGFVAKDDPTIVLHGGPGVPLPSPVGPGVPGFATPGFHGEEDFGIELGGGVPLPSPGPEDALGGVPGFSAGADFGTGVGGVPLPGSDHAAGSPGHFGGSDFGGGVALPGSDHAPGSPGHFGGSDFGGGVALPGSPPGQFGAGFDETSVRVSGVNLPGPVGPDAPFPSPTGSGSPGFFEKVGSDDPSTTFGGGVGGVPLPSPAGPPDFQQDSTLPVHCQLLGKTHPLILPPECRQDSSVGVALPDFGGDPAFHGPPAGPGVGHSSGGGGVPLPDFGGADGFQGDANFGSPDFGASGVGIGLPGPGATGSPGLGMPLVGSGSDGAMGFDSGVTLPVFETTGHGFGFGTDQGDFQGFSGGSVGVTLAETGGVEVPLQGPPHPVAGTGIPLTNEVGGNNRVHPNDAGFPFFESGPPESVPQAAGGPPTLALNFPLDPLPALTALPPKSTGAQGPSNHLVHKDAERLDPGIPLPGRTASEHIMEKTQDIQDVAKVYHDIYGIKMKLESSQAPGQGKSSATSIILPQL